MSTVNSIPLTDMSQCKQRHESNPGRMALFLASRFVVCANFANIVNCFLWSLSRLLATPHPSAASASAP